MAAYQPYIKSFTIIVALIETIINLLFISLLLSFVQFFSMSHTIRFHEMWKICIYLLAPYVIGSSLFIMFSNVLLYYAGFFITATYVFIVGRQVLKDVMRRDNHEL
jgi:peptidoglycan biosynthesis protein MviN/MurJ (putative lipid II flippase)